MSGGDLARRAVACPVWRWMPGMRVSDGGIVVFVDGSWLVTTVYIDDRDGWSTGSRIARHALPDLDDPATLGCLLALVREAWGNNWIHVVPRWPDGERFAYEPPTSADRPQEYEIAGFWGPRPQCLRCRFQTQDDALVAALEAAPRREVSP